MAKRIGFRLTGKSSSCDACSLIKSKAKAIPKTTEKKVLKVGENGIGYIGTFSDYKWKIP